MNTCAACGTSYTLEAGHGCGDSPAMSALREQSVVKHKQTPGLEEKLQADALHKRYRTISFDSHASPDHCVLCFKHRANTTETCLYGMHHEYPDSLSAEKKSAAKEQPRKVDKNVCLGC